MPQSENAILIHSKGLANTHVWLNGVELHDITDIKVSFSLSNPTTVTITQLAEVQVIVDDANLELKKVCRLCKSELKDNLCLAR